MAGWVDEKAHKIKIMLPHDTDARRTRARAHARVRCRADRNPKLNFFGGFVEFLLLLLEFIIAFALLLSLTHTHSQGRLSFRQSEYHPPLRIVTADVRRSPYRRR